MIHPSQQHERRYIGYGLLAIVAFSLGVWGFMPTPDITRGLANYAPLHTALEVFAVSVAFLVFAIAWVTQKFHRDGRILLLGLAFLGVGLLDLSHALSYVGMPDFITPSSPEKAINFWLAARALAAVVLLAVAFWPTHWVDWVNRLSRGWALAGTLVLVALVHAVFLFAPETLPRTFIDGQGLTPFKVYTEYVLIALYGLAGLGFLLDMRYPRASGQASLALAAFTMALGEYFFTLYANVTDLYNLAGHLYKVLAYVFLFRALFVQTVQRPYEELVLAENHQRATLDTLPDLLFEVNEQGRYLAVFASETHKLAAPENQLVGKTLDQVLPPAAVQACFKALAEADQSGISRGQRIALDLPIGQLHFELSVAKKRARHGEAASYLVLSRDVTAQAENEFRVALENELNRALLEVQQERAGETEADYLRRCVTLAERLTSSAVGCIHFVGNDSMQIELMASSTSHLPPEYDTLWKQALSESSQPTGPLQALNERRTVVLNDPAAAMGRLVTLPVQEKDQVRMLLCVGHKRSDYTEQEVKALEVLAAAIWGQALQRRQAALIHRMSEALDQSPNPIVITDTKVRIQYTNAAFSALSGYSAAEVQGKNPSLLKSGETPDSVYQELWKQLTQGQPWHGEFINRRKDGTLYHELASLYPIRDAQGHLTHYVAHKQDITERRASEARIQELSSFDSLTGLLNKRAFDADLIEALEDASAQGHRLTLVWFDLDNFKVINDTLGHSVGDELLVEVAMRLVKVLGPSSHTARYSGDAFLALLPEVDQDLVVLKIQSALDAIGETVTVGHELLAVTASVGIAVYPADAHSASALTSAAEMAMYRVKEDGRNGWRFFSPDMQAQSQRSLELITALKQALDRGELSVVYQPQCSLSSGKLVGAEALLRWQHPRLGAISPAEFIPIAEQSGLIVPIGLWVVEQVVRQLRAWDDHGVPVPMAAVNVSAVQFARPHLVEDLLDLTERFGVATSRLEIELTESVALKSPQAAGAMLLRLSEAGFRIALDDFGTGYSSMSYLKRYAVNKLKIDQSFVRELVGSSNDQALVRAMVQMAHGLGLTTIAEGVESPEQAGVLRQLGCDEMQGYLLSHPLSVHAFEVFVNEHGERL